MFGKLLKYDFRSMWKQFALIWPTALVLAIVNRFTLPGIESGSNSFGEIAAGVSMLFYLAVLMSMIVLVIVFIIQQFYKGLLRDEGYLMHTLPVKPRQLIGSKLTCAIVVMHISLLVAMASILLMVPMSGADFQLLWEDVIRAFAILQEKYDLNFLLFLLQLMAKMLTAMVTSFLQLYLAMAIGHLFSKNRIAASVVAYVSINAVISAISNILSTPVLVSVTTTVNSGLYTADDALQLAADSLNSFPILPYIAFDLALSAVFFVATGYILKNKLNLE